MSKYTTEVRFICESYAGLKESAGYDEVDEIVEASRRKIFGDYPIFDENYRAILETKILKHYYTREISEETVGLWKLRLNSRMNEIMPYFNKLYNSELIEFNPLFDVDLTRDYKKQNEGNEDSTNKTASDSETNTQNTNTNTRELSRSESDTENTQMDTSRELSNESTSWNMFQDTPQGGLTGVENNAYLSSATKVTNETSESTEESQIGENTRSNTVSETDENNGSDTGKQTYTGNSNNEFNSKINGMEDYIEHIKGTNGGMSYSKRIKEFRDTFLNIDLQVIDNLKNLFFYLW